MVGLGHGHVSLIDWFLVIGDLWCEFRQGHRVFDPLKSNVVFTAAMRQFLIGFRAEF